MSVLNEYEVCLGQKINLSNSEILFSPNVSVTRKDDICEILNVVEVKSFRDYLGLWTFIGREKKKAFQGLKDKIWRRLSG